MAVRFSSSNVDLDNILLRRGLYINVAEPVMPNSIYLSGYVGDINTSVLPDAGLANLSTPVQLTTDTQWVSISLGDPKPMFLINSENQLFVLGDDIGFSQTVYSNGLGDRFDSHPSPVQVGTDADWKSVFVNDQYNVFAFKNDESVWCWGFNSKGVLGLNDTVFRSTPVLFASSGWSSIHGGREWSIGLKTNNTLWAWGSLTNGLSGNNNGSITRSSPIQVGIDTDWQKIKGGRYSAYGLKLDGSLWTWGNNTFGQLGHNEVISKSTPVQIGFTIEKDWKDVFVGYESAYAIKNDGTLWSWGNNANGQLGVGTTLPLSSPTQVGFDTDWQEVFPYTLGVFAKKTDGSLWAWGYNNKGQLGLNSTLQTLSPTQVSTVGSSTKIVSILDGDIGYTAFFLT